MRIYGADTPRGDQRHDRKPMIIVLRWYYANDVLAKMILEAEANKGVEWLTFRVKLGLFGQ